MFDVLKVEGDIALHIPSSNPLGAIENQACKNIQGRCPWAFAPRGELYLVGQPP